MAQGDNIAEQSGKMPILGKMPLSEKMPIPEKMPMPGRLPVLHLNELAQGKHHFSYRLDDRFIQELPTTYGVEKSEIIGCAIDAEAELLLRENDYSLHIHAQGDVRLICDRCLAPMTYAVDVSDEIEPDDDETNGETLDISWLTYEMITINLPLVHSHPEGECMQDMQKLLQSHLCSTVEEDPEQ
ncbi:MAG: hypothetical protein IJQ97_00160 [Paludibacteraceae bacterium]|nr:hypothetical protein [Paludibacteraceae bacterium]